MKTRPIGERFKLTEYHPGLPETIVILEVVENLTGSCKDCHIRRACMNRPSNKEYVGNCSKTTREDGKSVVFKKVGWL